MCKGSKKQFIVAKIVDKRGNLLSIATNSYKKTNPRFWYVAHRLGYDKKEYIHAEARAVLKLSYNDRDRAYAMYVYRFFANGKPALAKPCRVCQEFIRMAGIRKVYYTTESTTLDMEYPEYIELKNSSDWL